MLYDIEGYSHAEVAEIAGMAVGSSKGPVAQGPEIGPGRIEQVSSSMNEQDLLKSLAELPREIRPGRDPWPEISARIEQSLPGAGQCTGRSVGCCWPRLRPLCWPWWWGCCLNQLDRWPGAFEWAGHAAAASNPDARISVCRRCGIPGCFQGVHQCQRRTQWPEPETVEKIEMTWADLRVMETALAAALTGKPG